LLGFAQKTGESVKRTTEVLLESLPAGEDLRRPFYGLAAGGLCSQQ